MHKVTSSDMTTTIKSSDVFNVMHYIYFVNITVSPGSFEHMRLPSGQPQSCSLDYFPAM